MPLLAADGSTRVVCASPPASQGRVGRWVLCNLRISHHVELVQTAASPRLLRRSGLRILPGLWACLAVTAFVIAPLGVAIQGGSPGRLVLSLEPIKYVLANSAVLIVKHDIGGEPQGIPWPGQWDGSLWTLVFEAMCYIAIAVLGVIGLLRRRWLIPALFALALLWSARLPLLSGVVEEPPGAGNQVDAATAMMVVETVTARFAVMFLAGALAYQFRNLIPARWSLVAAERGRRSGVEHAAELPAGRRHSAGLCHRRFRCSRSVTGG